MYIRPRVGETRKKSDRGSIENVTSHSDVVASSDHVTRLEVVNVSIISPRKSQT